MFVVDSECKVLAEESVAKQHRMVMWKRETLEEFRIIRTRAKQENQVDVEKESVV